MIFDLRGEIGFMMIGRGILNKQLSQRRQLAKIMVMLMHLLQTSYSMYRQVAYPTTNMLVDIPFLQ